MPIEQAPQRDDWTHLESPDAGAAAITNLAGRSPAEVSARRHYLNTLDFGSHHAEVDGHGLQSVVLAGRTGLKLRAPWPTRPRGGDEPNPESGITVTSRSPPGLRAAYPHFLEITTRWIDNDVYRHVNNVVYYAYFDTVVNQLLVEKGVLDIERSPVIGLVVETQCRYFSPISFPSKVHAGLRVAHLGTSSVRYEVGLFRDSETTASAEGRFVHVYVDRDTSRPVPLSEALRDVLTPLVVAAPRS